MADRIVSKAAEAVRQKLAAAGKKPAAVQTYSADFMKKKPNNLYDLVLPAKSSAIGMKVARSIWRRPETYITITKFKPINQDPAQRRGKVWGVLTYNGKMVDGETPKPVRSGCKREWHIFDPNYHKKFEDESLYIQNQKYVGGAPSIKELQQQYLEFRK
ncbi:hypothetical protein PROFUN_08134 [Planoprotostelium fungivorum]|uniref:Uncharacterized protein n=1 Tax=Planoprotostelium fungivorum TaxID=1890364 RepID=A0A2P6MQG0_9EUKA|nr:hypothetical protein PROFUN_08134 [Planoprotostelium fungivorum]